MGRTGGVGVAIGTGVAKGAAGWGSVSGIRSVDAGEFSDGLHALSATTSAVVIRISVVRISRHCSLHRQLGIRVVISWISLLLRADCNISKWRFSR
jgi:hypothetical protein